MYSQARSNQIPVSGVCSIDRWAAWHPTKLFHNAVPSQFMSATPTDSINSEEAVPESL